MPLFFRLLLLVLLLSPVSPAAAALPLDGAQTRVDTLGHLEVLEDPGGQLDAAHANAAQNWRKLPGRLNAGYTPNPHWLRLRVAADEPLPGGWMLRLGNALLDDVQVYAWRPALGWQLLGHSGEDVPRQQWPVGYRSAVIPFEIDQAGEQVLLLRLQSKNALVTSLEVWQRLAFDNHSRREGLFFGLHFGVYLLLIGLVGVFWMATRAPMSGLILLYLGLSVLNEVLSLGLIQQITGVSAVLSDRLLAAGFACNLLVGFRVSLTQLRVPAFYPRASLLLDRLIQGVAGLCLLLALAGQFVWSVLPVVWLGMVLILGFSATCALFLWRGHRHARFFAVAFGVFYLGVLTRFLRNLGLLPLNHWTEHASALGTMLHMLLLSLWLIGRSEHKRRALQRWRANLAANLAREHSLRLEREVAQRTSDLRQEIQRREVLELELRNALQLEQRVRTEQRDFVAMVSHEFRTPLAIITTLSQRIEQGTPAPGVRNVERCQQIREAASRLLALVDEYLSDDRMGESDAELKLGPCDLSALLQELSEDYPPERIRIQLERVPERLVTDAGLLHIALRNLLANADRHAAAEATVQVEVAAGQELDGWLHVDIRNPGGSIPAGLLLPRVLIRDLPQSATHCNRGRQVAAPAEAAPASGGIAA